MSNNLYYENKITNGEQIQKVSLSELKPFEEQPFKVLMDESMDELVESIKDSGVLSPIIVRPHKDGGYEILSGHRRAKACELAGKENVPVIVRNLDDDMATIFLVDSNLQRENILPSEKAYAYKLKFEAMKRRAGRPPKNNGDQIGHDFAGKKSVDILSENAPDSRNQIQRYIRLTELIDPLLDMVDAKKLPVNAAVELSYLGTKAQSDIVKAIEKYEATPSIEQSAKIRKYAKDGKVNEDVIDSIMQEQKPEKIKITFKEDKLRKYFPKSYTQKQMEETMTKLLENWARKRREPER
jgi:ParB family chromosome partitioning protein